MSQGYGTQLLKHGMAQINPGLRLHYVTEEDGNRIIVLLHGFPQTRWGWRHVIPILANAGLGVIAPDYRGAGNSSRPIGGYDKRTLASDIHLLPTNPDLPGLPLWSPACRASIGSHRTPADCGKMGRRYRGPALCNCRRGPSPLRRGSDILDEWETDALVSRGRFGCN
jgi:hypothetical protein